jgi:hypothetical protein
MRGLAAETMLVAADSAWAMRGVACKWSGGRFADSPQLYRAGVLRQRLTAAPGMTSLTERACYVWHAEHRYSGAGEIVDLGSWFGSTTAALAMGLSRNSQPLAQRRRVHAYDQFTWETWMDEYAHLARFGPYSPGDSFRREFERTVAPWRPRIELHAGNLLEQRWEHGPLEILLVDAMKSWELTTCVLERFFPFLLPSQGHVIHQDFAHWYTPWIHLVTYRLRDYLVPVQDVHRSDTVVFRVVRPLDEDRGRALRLTRDSFDPSEVEDAFRYSLSITVPEKHPRIHAARIMLLVHDGDLGAARALLESCEARRLVGRKESGAIRGTMAAAPAREQSRNTPAQ